MRKGIADKELKRNLEAKKQKYIEKLSTHNKTFQTIVYPNHATL